MRLCAAVLLAGSVGMAGSVPQEQLTIRVVDYVPVPSATLSEAVLVSRGILKDAGIETTWLTCRIFEEGSCPSTVQPSEIRVNLLKQSEDRHTAASGVLGCVLRDKQTAFGLYVFYRRVEEVARSSAFGTSVLLGMVVTHELGHYFGLNDGHWGIMLSSFYHRETMMQGASGMLSFDKRQAAHLRNAIANMKAIPEPGGQVLTGFTPTQLPPESGVH